MWFLCWTNLYRPIYRPSGAQLFDDDRYPMIPDCLSSRRSAPGLSTRTPSWSALGKSFLLKEARRWQPAATAASSTCASCRITYVEAPQVVDLVPLGLLQKSCQKHDDIPVAEPKLQAFAQKRRFVLENKRNRHVHCERLPLKREIENAA